MSISTYTPSSDRIVHSTKVDLISRQLEPPLHIVQYDNSLPVVEVELFKNGQPYTIPDSISNIYIRCGNRDVKVYNKILGSNSNKTKLYFEVTQIMAKNDGQLKVVIEFLKGKEVASSSVIIFSVDRNPIQENDILSSEEFKVFDDYVEDTIAAQQAAESAAQTATTKASEASASASTASNMASVAESAAETASYNAGVAMGAAQTATDKAEEASESAETAALKAAEIESAAQTATAKASEATTAAQTASEASTEATTAAASALLSESNATTAANNASTSAQTAATKASEAATSAQTAATKAAEAASSADGIVEYAKKSESYAVGDTDYRPGEATDNAKYYYEQARLIAQGLSGGLRPKGTITFANLPSIQNADDGDMYNIIDSFTTTSDFEEGAGHDIAAGADVYKTINNKWDVLAGSAVSGVKGNNESTYRTGNVNITKENIGLENVDNTSDVNKPLSNRDKQEIVKIANADEQWLEEQPVGTQINIAFKRYGVPQTTPDDILLPNAQVDDLYLDLVTGIVYTLTDIQTVEDVTTYTWSPRNSGVPLTRKIDMRSKIPTMIPYTIRALGWLNNVYTFTEYPATSYDLEICTSSSMTMDQYNALSSAKLIGSTDVSINSVTALGDIPEIDIPILLKVRRK